MGDTFIGKIYEADGGGFLTRKDGGKIFFIDKYSPLRKDMHVGEEWEFRVKFEKEKWGVVVPIRRIETDVKEVDVKEGKCKWYKDSGDYMGLYKEEDWEVELQWDERGCVKAIVHCPSMDYSEKFIICNPDDKWLKQFFSEEQLQKEILPKLEKAYKKEQEKYKKTLYKYWYKFWQTIKHKIENNYDIVGLKINKNLLPPVARDWSIDKEKTRESRLPALIIKDKIYYLSGYNLNPLEYAPDPVLRVHKLTDYIKNNKIEKIPGYTDMVLLKPIDEIEYERRDDTNQAVVFDSEIKYVIKKFIYSKGMNWKGKIKISVGIGDLYRPLGRWDRNLLLLKVEGYCLRGKYCKKPGKKEVYYRVERGVSTYVGASDDWGGATGWGYHAGPSVEYHYHLLFIEIDPHIILRAPEKHKIRWLKTVIVNITDDLAQKLQKRREKREYLQRNAEKLMRELSHELEDFIYL